MDPNTSAYGGSPFPSGRYTWSDQQTIGDRSVFSEGSQVPGSEIHHGQGGVHYGWTPPGLRKAAIMSHKSWEARRFTQKWKEEMFLGVIKSC